MKKISLSFKLTFSFIVVSMSTLAFLYFVFYSLFEYHMLKVESEKATLIAQTIEPMIGMNYYLGLNDEIKQLAEQTDHNDQIISLSVVIKDDVLWSSLKNKQHDGIKVEYPIKDPVTSSRIGNITLIYKKDAFNKALSDVQDEILYYLGALSVIFVIFAFLTRLSLSPLGKIAKMVKDYKLGSVLDFSTLRTQPETEVIVNAFEGMVSNIREYTVLLERYKQSIDESSIVIRMDVDGKITYVNDEFCRLSGYSFDESLNTQIFSVCHSEEDSNLCTEMLNVTRNKKIWKKTFKNQAKDGKPYYVKTTVVPILDDRDQIIELISIQHDITQIIEQQEQISRQTTDVITGLPNRIKLEEDIIGLKAPKFAMISLENYKIIKDYFKTQISVEIKKDNFSKQVFDLY